VYDHFYPAFRAGGPIQSLVNLAVALEPYSEISVFTSAYDHNMAQVLDGVQTDTWLQVKLANASNAIKVWYASPKKRSKKIFAISSNTIQPDVIYINGIFSYRFVIIPLLTKRNPEIKVVLCPRGMLQTGALETKWLKKKIYLNILKISGLLNNVNWHATNEAEGADIKKIFGDKVKIFVAGNLPKKPVSKIAETQKRTGQLRLIYLSLIAEKKNLFQVIELIKNSDADIVLDIYGPVKDTAYWKKCKAAITAGTQKIKYMGDLLPEQVQETFSKYDACILLTRGENFGHALYESMSAGRPIITSFFTPWNNLEEKKAGWNLDIADNAGCLHKLNSIAQMESGLYDAFCIGAYNLANEYYKQSADLSNYHEMFTKPGKVLTNENEHEVKAILKTRGL
jgi:glycosyltransferase involved in cell wall biosynthesis